jgi:hypothetical protein
MSGTPYSRERSGDIFYARAIAFGVRKENRAALRPERISGSVFFVEMIAEVVQIFRDIIHLFHLFQFRGRRCTTTVFAYVLYGFFVEINLKLGAKSIHPFKTFAIVRRFCELHTTCNFASGLLIGVVEKRVIELLGFGKFDVRHVVHAPLHSETHPADLYRNTE